MDDLSPKGYLISIKNDEEGLCKYPVRSDVCYIGGGIDCNIRLQNEDIDGRCCKITFWDSKSVSIMSCKQHLLK